MSDVNSEEMEHYTPQHPLPETIRKMDRGETVCRYCGVSYLIHSEIKALEKKVKSLEKQLEHFQGSQEREAKLKEELIILQEQRGEFEMNITVKDAAISTLTNNLMNQKELSERLRNEKEDTEKKIQSIEVSNKELKERNNLLERNLPNLQFALQQQKVALEDIQSYIADRDKHMQEEVAMILGHVRSSCDLEIQEKEKLMSTVKELQSVIDGSSSESEEMKQRLMAQEKELQQLDAIYEENKLLQQKCIELDDSRIKLQKELEEALEHSRKLKLEIEQFREQFKSKKSELEELTTKQRHKEQALEMTTQKLKSDLKKKDADLLGAQRELKDLQNKYEQQQQIEADLSRKANKNTYETEELKDSFFKAKEEVERLKEEREAMITSHQNRIEQLRESFKEKMADAERWEEKLEAAIQLEKEKHERELRALEQRLKESFVLELEIEKGKYQELMRKYQAGSQETEEKLRAQLMSIESRYKAEISDLNELLKENRKKSKAMEDELRKEIASLKAIIQDLEGRLARLDYGNEELVAKLKIQLKETHQELEDTRKELDKRNQAAEEFQQEIKHLQETVHKECEERFELTEALSAAKEELLLLKKPPGSPESSALFIRRHSHPSGYMSHTPRQLSSLSQSRDEDTAEPRHKLHKSPISQVPPPIRPQSSRAHTYTKSPQKEYTLTASNNMVFTGENNHTARPVGGSRTSGSLADNRRRIAAILGRK